MSIGKTICMPIGETIGETVHTPVSGLEPVDIDQTKIGVARRRMSCIVSCSQPAFLQVVVSVIEDDMTVRTADSERVDGDPAKADRRPRRLFERELEPPFGCWDLRVDFLKIDVWRDDAVLKDKDGFDDTVLR